MCRKRSWILNTILFVSLSFLVSCSSVIVVPTSQVLPPEEKAETQNSPSIPPSTTITNTPDPTATNTTTPTKIPTSTHTPKPTNTFTPKPTPVLTELGASAYQIASVLNWDVIICGDEVDQKSFEDGSVGYEDGIFPLTENTEEYFCGFTGYQPEPVPEPSLTIKDIVGQMAISLVESKYELNGSLVTQYALAPTILTKVYFPYPSLVEASDILSKLYEGEFENIAEFRKQENYNIPIKIWPLTEEELKKLESSLPYLLVF